jgi:Amt family ammonium transporter
LRAATARVGWYGFNPGSMLAIVGADSAAVVARSAVTTTIAAASGGRGLYNWVERS